MADGAVGWSTRAELLYGWDVRAPVDVPRVRDYLRMLASGWLVIVAATVLSAGAAVGVHQMLRVPTYTASTQLFAVVTGDPGVYATNFGGAGATVRMTTYVQLAKSALVTQRTINDVGLDTTAEELADKISAATVPDGVSRFGRPNSALLKVQVTGDDPDTTVKTANALAKNLIAASQELEWSESKPGDEIQYFGPVAQLVPVDVALSAHEVQTSRLREMGVGAGIGLALSSFVVLAMGIARDTVLSRGHVDHIVTQALSGQTLRSVP